MTASPQARPARGASPSRRQALAFWLLLAAALAVGLAGSAADAWLATNDGQWPAEAGREAR